MSSATVEEFVELLNAEQHVDLQKLRDLARHGVQPSVRGEVWLYLLGVLSDDKGQEMTSVRSKYLAYEGLDKHNPALEKRVRSECQRYYQKRLGMRLAPTAGKGGRGLMRSSRSVLARRPGGFSSATGMGLSGMGGNGGGGGVLGRDYMMEGASSSQSLLSSSSSSSMMMMGENGPHSAVTGAPSLATGTLMTADRGPNRVNDGRIHALGGIIGESGVSAAMDADDPDAAAALELKRFGRSVENIICAFMNRCSAAETARRRAAQGISGNSAHAAHHAEAINNGSSSSAQNAEGARGRMQHTQAERDQWEDDPFRSSQSSEDGSGKGLFHDTSDGTVSSRSTASRHGHNHTHHGSSSGTSSRSRSRAGSISKGSGGGADVGNTSNGNTTGGRNELRSKTPSDPACHASTNGHLNSTHPPSPAASLAALPNSTLL